MSIVPKETIEVIAQSVGITNLLPEAALMLARDVEYRVREIMQACLYVTAVTPSSPYQEWAEVKVVASKSSLSFVDKPSLPQEVTLYTDEDEWCSWKKIGDPVLHIELRRWLVL